MTRTKELIEETADAEVLTIDPCSEIKVKTQLSQADKDELKSIILKKIENAKKGFEDLKEAVNGGQKSNDTRDTSPTFKFSEDGESTASLEKNSKLAKMQENLIESLNRALMRMENKTYDGKCHATDCPCGGALMPMERLRSTPHATKCCLAKEGLDQKKEKQLQKSRKN